MFSPMASNYFGFFSSEPSSFRIEELHAQRSYLLSNLQQENLKATDLLRKLPGLEETLTRSQTSTGRRRARKQIGWLKYRINETTRQETTILNRLNQLAQEIASKESQSRIENEQRRYGSNISDSLATYHEMQQMCLSTTGAAHHLREYPFPYVPTPEQQQTHEFREFPWRQSFCDRVSEMPSDIFSPISPHSTQFPNWIPEPNAQTRVLAPVTSNSVSRRPRSSSMSSLDVKGLSTKMLSVPRSTVKGHSIGCSQEIRIWADDKEDEGFQDDDGSGSCQYSGYFLNR